MSDIGSIQSTAAAAVTQRGTGGAGPVVVSSAPVGAQRAADQVQLSDRARLLSQLSALPDVRQNMIDLAKSRVASGFYDNETVIDQTIDKLSHEIGN
ncbi:MAG: flagellar biosynthesis anti-sigma factor FlgM [Phycisphaerales bacterium]